MMEKMHLDGLDIGILVLYFLGIFGAGIYAMFRSNRNSVNGYFLAGRFMTWLPVGASLFASNIGSEHFIGLAGSGAANGIAVGAFEFNAAVLLQLLGWVFLPVYLASGSITLPEYMKRRFGGMRIQLYLTLLSLILYIFTKISVNLYSGALFVNEALGWNIWYSILFLLLLTAVITLTGGLAAVLYTDLVQCIVMLAGAIILTGLGFYQIGGFPGLLASYGKAINPINATDPDGADLLVNLSNIVLSTTSATGLPPTVSELARLPNVSSEFTCRLPSSKAFVMLRGVSDPEMPWLGFLLGQTPASIWYWCADQMMVQRVLAAKSLSHAQGATLMAGLIKLFPIYIMILPGMISRVLYPSTVGCGTPEACVKVCNNRHGCSDWAYPKLVMGVLPKGLRGLMLAVMLAALMSDLTSIFNSSSTLFTVDIYSHIRKSAGNRELMIVGRLFVVLMVGLSILWVPVIQSMQGGQLFIYIQSISAYLSPPIAAVYLMAILWKRNNEVGAFTGLVYGFLLGVVRMGLSFFYPDPICGEVDTRPWVIGRVHYMYFAMISFFSTAIIMCIASLLSKPPTVEKLNGLTFWTRREPVILRESPVSIRVGEEISVNGFWDDLNTDHGVGSDRSVFSDADPPQNPNSSGDAADYDSIPKIGYQSSTPGDTRQDGEVDCHQRPSKLQIAGHVCEWICGLTTTPCPENMEPSTCCCTFCYSKSHDNYSADDDREEEGINSAGDVIEIHDANWTSDIHSEQQKAEGQNHTGITHPGGVDSLKQKRSTKIGLSIGLVGLSVVTIFLYLFFTFFFGEIDLGPVPVVWSNKTSPGPLDNALRVLEMANIISTSTI
uniref:Sodium/myo-inositol cotransporter n=3 Tax=Schistocephalus solidus TaxID=70667 RepID=A0A0X3NWJ4_SCHSO